MGVTARGWLEDEWHGCPETRMNGICIYFHICTGKRHVPVSFQENAKLDTLNTLVSLVMGITACSWRGRWQDGWRRYPKTGMNVICMEYLCA